MNDGGPFRDEARGSIKIKKINASGRTCFDSVPKAFSGMLGKACGNTVCPVRRQ